MSVRLLKIAITLIVVCACTYWLKSPNLGIIVLLVGVGSVVAGKDRRIG